MLLRLCGIIRGYWWPQTRINTGQEVLSHFKASTHCIINTQTFHYFVETFKMVLQLFINSPSLPSVCVLRCFLVLSAELCIAGIRTGRVRKHLVPDPSFDYSWIQFSGSQLSHLPLLALEQPVQ